MAEDPDLSSVPRATVVPRRRARLSVVWIIPILAAVVAVGIAVQRILNEGPTITIIFTGAEGVEAGKTFVKYKDVNIGQVTAVRLTPDYAKVEVTAKIAKSAEGLIVEDAKFWVVEPRVTLSGVSGLGTLLSGNYIGFEVGTSPKKQRRFTGIETPPIITGGQPGTQFVLTADNLGSLGIGSPIYYRRLQAGQVVAYDLAADGTAVDLKIFVTAPYDQFVTPATRFWNASGVDVSLGAAGVDVRMQSLVSLLAGGLAFDTPAFAAKAAPAPAATVFTLYNDQTTALKQPDAIAAKYVLYFDESLRGLSVGAPVTLLGLPAGQVTDVGLDLDPTTLNIRGRVEIVSFPERLIARLDRQQTAALAQSLTGSAHRRHAVFQRLVEQRGLRAQLRSGNLLTGQLFVALDYFPHAPKARIDWTREVPVLPAVPSTLPDVEAKLANIVAKLEQLPLEAIGADVTKVLAALHETIQTAGTALTRIDADVTPQLTTTLEGVRGALTTADGLLKNDVNTTLVELRRTVATADAMLTDQVTPTLAELRRAVATADAVLKNTDATLLGAHAPVQQELRDALQEITTAARSLRVLMDYLERHPDALIWGKTKEKP